MVKRELPAEKTHYILLVCNMTFLNLLVLRYPLRQEHLILGRFVESRTPLEDFKIFQKFFFLNCIYAHILNLNLKKILILKQIEFRHFRVQNPLKEFQKLFSVTLYLL